MVKSFKLLCSKQSLRTGKITSIEKYHTYFQINCVGIPVWGKIFRTRPDGSWGPPSLLYNGYPIVHRSETAGLEG